ncbi:MAG: peptide chain release factor 2 [Deinococcus-Thermus bacterium]|uniref:peptide chain release factor 2 n=1 Tax=Meiothermus luteus TaxID=2026184 RepID=UPI000E64E4BD|nr:peptide chain release factor 2 [Meiothermus luteus]RMH55513.1 MAG: peptide chain release factor 2 [Deinococcota bacterium]
MELETLRHRLDALRGYLDIAGKEARLGELEPLLNDPHLWNDAEKARKLSQEAARLRKAVEGYRRLESDLQGLLELWAEMGAEQRAELQPELERAGQELEELYRQTLLSFPYAENAAIVTIKPGAGGTEACDWAQMLYRMYTRFAERKGFSVELVDLEPGAEAGIDHAQFIVRGENAYGLLSAEAGVHRLVRPSPFNAQGKRQTSFAAVEVMPEVDDTVEVQINPEDLRIEVMRSQGKGGQGVNTTDSAVRVVHLPTGLQVKCQITRSQQKNKELALSILRSKLFEIEFKKKQEELARLRGEARPIEWGSQIRSYVLDKQYVKDHRTGEMRHDPENVLDGDLESLIWAGLEWKAGRRETAAVGDEE